MTRDRAAASTAKPPASMRRQRLARRARLALGVLVVAGIAYRLIQMFR